MLIPREARQQLSLWKNIGTIQKPIVEKRLKLRNYFLIAAVLQIVWGLVPSASKMVLDEIPVELYVALRWSISGVIFTAYLILTKSWKPLSRRDFFSVSLLGLLGYGAASFGTLYGLKTGGVTNFALMSAMGPVIMALASIWILKEKPAKLFYFALPCSVFGLLCLMIGKAEISSFQIAGLSALFVLGGYALEAVVFVSSRSFKSKMNIAQYLAVAQLSAAGFLWILQISVFHQTSQLTQLSTRGLAAALFVSIVACVLCYAVLYWLLRYLDGHRLALFEGIHALSATFFGTLIFGEQLTFLMLTGGALILIGLVAGNYAPDLRELE